MRIDLLEDWKDKGLITKEAQDRIYATCESIVNTVDVPAPELMEFAKHAQAGQFFGQLLGTALGAMVGHEAVNVLEGMKEKGRERSGPDKLLKVRDAMLENEPFKSHPEKAVARFNELATYSPHSAMDKNFAPKIIEKNLHSGFTSNDAANLALIQTQLSLHSKPNPEKYIPKSPMSPEALGKTAATICFLQKQAEEKTGKVNVGELLKGLAIMSGASFALGAGGAVAGKLWGMKREKELKEDLEKSYGEAVQLSDPEKEPLHSSPEKARQAFQTLTHFAPNIAVQPQAARAFMSKLVQYDQGLSTTDLKDLASIEKDLMQSKALSPASEGFGAVSKHIGMPGLTQSAYKTFMDPIAKDFAKM